MAHSNPGIEPGLSWWEVATSLVGACDEAGGVEPPSLPDEDFDTWDLEVNRLRDWLLNRVPRARLGDEDAAVIAQACRQGPISWSAAAWAIDHARHETFSRSWVLGAEIWPGAGDLFPVCDWNTVKRPLDKKMPRPWLTQRAAGELPHVRIYRPQDGQPAVVFDGRYFDEIEFLNALNAIAFLTPNASITDDFDVPTSGFPIGVRDLDAQSAVIRSFVAETISDGQSGLAILPELAGTEAATELVAEMVGAAERHLAVLAGTRHVVEEGVRKNLASLILPSGRVVESSKRTPFWDGNGREGIDPTTEPMRILISSEVRVAVLICKDFLVQTILGAAAHAGANLVLVPSLSRRLDLHDVSARELASRSHGLSVIANGPWEIGADRPPTALIGRPESDPDLAVQAARASAPNKVVRHHLASAQFTED